MCFLIGKFCLNLVFPFILISSKFVTIRKDEMLVTLLCDQHFIFPDSNKLRAYENEGEDQVEAKFPNKKTHCPF